MGVKYFQGWKLSWQLEDNRGLIYPANGAFR